MNSEGCGDVKFFGATTGKYMLWDESADTLAIVGAISMNGTAGKSVTLTNAPGTTTVTGYKRLIFDSGILVDQS